MLVGQYNVLGLNSTVQVSRKDAKNAKKKTGQYLLLCADFDLSIDL